MQPAKICFIGAGNMAYSLISGLISDGYSPQNIWASRRDEIALQRLKDAFDIHFATDNVVVAEQTDVWVLTVKPHTIPVVCRQLQDLAKEKKPLIVSVAAALRLAQIQRWLGCDCPIVRAMPNIAALLRVGATGLLANGFVDSNQKQLAESIMRAVGLVVWLENDDQVDVVAALSGSGPAYFFFIMEILEEISEQLGLSKEVAQTLILQTALGVARMGLESEKNIRELRSQVTSPGGTTEVALKILEHGNIKQLFMDALSAACNRAQELSQLIDDGNE